jgi:dTDP-4-dehydrorhamnose reductase
VRKRGCDLAAQRVVPLPSTERPAPAKRPLNSRLSLARLSERFGIAPPDWRTALRPVLDATARAERNKLAP